MTGADPQPPTGGTADTGSSCGAELLGGGCGFSGTEIVPCDADTASEQLPGALPGSLEGGGLCACGVGGGPGLPLILLSLWWIRRALWACVLGLGLGLSAPAWGQVDAQQLQIGDGGDFPALWEADLGQPWAGSITASFNGANDLAVLHGVPGAGVLLERVWTWELASSLNLGGVARGGLSVPYHAITFAGDRLDGLTPGDLSVWLAVPLSRDDREATASWMVRMDVPTGPRELLLGDVGVVTGSLALSFPAGLLEGLLNVGAAMQQDVPLPGVLWGSHWVYGVGLRAEPLGPSWITGELSGNAPVKVWAGVPAQYRTEALLSGGVVATRQLSAGLGIGAGLGRGLGSPSLRWIGMVDVRPRIERDSDGDGIADLRDVCRHQPEDRDQHRDADGCPDPDNDGDGLADRADECPDQPEVVNNFLDADGCPDRMTPLTVRVEAVEGLESATVAVGAGRPVVLFAGESLERRLDLDSVDVSVTAPGFHPHAAQLQLPGLPIEHVVALQPVRYGTLVLRVADPQGRPLAPRVQLDGGALLEDPGPLRLEVGEVALVVSAQGHHPVPVSVAIPADQEIVVPVVLQPASIELQGNRLQLDDAIAFALDEAALDPVSEAVVGDLAAWLVVHPEVRLLRIEGHADASGASQHNYALSVRRAEAVRDALVAQGIAADRLDAIGSGEAPGDGAEAQRRVDFVVLVWREPDPAPQPPQP